MQHQVAAITNCPCGTVHWMTLHMWAATTLILQDVPPDVTVTCVNGSWLVPRIYLACHGLPQSANMPDLAEKHGWKREIL